MADSKLAGADKKVIEISPMAKTTGLDARTRSERKDRTAKEQLSQAAVSGSAGPAPVGAPRKFEFEGKTYSPRNPDPANPNLLVTQPVHQLVAAYEGAMQGQETDEEATQRHNREAEAEAAERQANYKAEYEARLAEADKAEAALDAALEASKKSEESKKQKQDDGSWQLMHGDGGPEPAEITKSNPFADPAQTPVATPQPAATPAEGEQIVTPNPTPKRKKSSSPNPSRDEEDEDEEMEGGGRP